MTLTLIECGYAACVLDAMTHKEIAKAMGVTPLSALKAMVRLRKKLGARNVTHLALILRDMA